MTEGRPHSFAAQVLEASASAYAGVAASRLLERRPKIAERHGPGALHAWQAHLRQRILELAAALDVEEPKLFASSVRWARETFRAREMSDGDLRAGLACLRDALRDELPEPAQRAVVGYLEQALAALDEKPAEGGEAPTKPSRLTLRYLEAALSGDGSRAIDLVAGAVDEGLSVEKAYDVLIEAQREIGRMWHAGEVAVVEEHVVTSITARATAVLAQRAPRSPENGKTVLVAAVTRNRHSLAVRVLADFFEIAGWRSIHLGADVPVSDVARAVAFFDADLLVLSVALTTQLRAARQAIAAVRELDERDVKVLVGGVALAAAPELWRRLGADGSAPTAAQALTLGARLVGLEP